MMLYRNTEAKICQLDRDTDFFDIFAGDIFAQYVFIIWLDYVLWTSIDLIKENGIMLKQKKPRDRRYPAETKINAEYAYDRALLANIPTQTESH